jgi:hypothetical protein
MPHKSYKKTKTGRVYEYEHAYSPEAGRAVHVRYVGPVGGLVGKKRVPRPLGSKTIKFIGGKPYVYIKTAGGWKYSGPSKEAPRTQIPMPSLSGKAGMSLYDTKMMEAWKRAGARITRARSKAKEERAAIRAEYPMRPPGHPEGGRSQNQQNQMEGRLAGAQRRRSAEIAAAEAQYRKDTAVIKTSQEFRVPPPQQGTKQFKRVGKGPSELAKERAT